MNVKIDAFNKIKEVVDRHNLDISDQEIIKCVEDCSEIKPLSFILTRCSAKESLIVINQQINSNFTFDTPLNVILEKISEKWNEL